MDRMHWTVRALFSCSMLLGLFAVYFATSMQQTVGLLNNLFYLRLWLSRGSPYPQRLDKEPHKYLPLDGSVATLRLLQTPQRLLNLSALLFLVGYGLYLLFSWKYDSHNLGRDYRNAFIVLMAVTGVALLDYVITSVCLLFDAYKRYSEFGIGSQSFDESPMRNKLEHSFNELQRVLASNKENTIPKEEDLNRLADIIKDIDQAVKETLEKAKESSKASSKRVTTPTCHV